MSSASQRRVPRKKVNRPAGILVRGEYLVGRVVQVGEGGVMLEANHQFAENDRLLVTFSLRGDDFITSKATIRYIKETEKKSFSFGVEFDELPFQSRREIRSFVASQNKEALNH